MMQSIEIDQQVHAELSRRATGFNVTPNDVLRQVLNLPPPSLDSVSTTAASPPSGSVPPTLSGFIRSERFQRHNQAVDKYLVLLGWLFSSHGDDFVIAAFSFQRGSRPYFGKSEEEIVKHAPGSTARQIPACSHWALTTLDNKSKRIVLEDLLTTLSYPPADVAAVLAEIPDSGIWRGRNGARARLLALL